MKNIYTLFLLIAVSTITVTAQNSKTRRADQLYDRLQYTDAAKAYQKLLKKGEGSSYVFEQLGNCYYFINDTKKAETYYKRVVKRKKTNPETVYNYAQSVKANGKFGDYNTYMKQFAKMKPNDSRAIDFMKNPDYLPKIMDENMQQYTAKNADQLNSKLSDFGGTMVGNELYFASARNTMRKTYGWNEEPFLDIYKASNVGGTLKNVTPINGDVNTKYHESSVSITSDGKRMYFDSNDYYKGKYKKSGKGINQINIYYAENIDGAWKDIQPVPFNSSEYSTGHPSLSPDGNTLYFSSDRPGGKGQSDIYKVSISKDGTFGTPQRLGDNINTEGKEVFPSMDSNGTLYFSSDAHLGIGGLDVYSAEPQGKDFGKVKNLGLGVNSSEDDFAFTFNPATKEGFVSSNRKGGKGSDDIYTIKKIEICDVTINAIVIDGSTKKPIPSARLDLYDGKENQLKSETVGLDGKGTIIAACNQKHVVQGFKDGYESNAVTVDASKNGIKNITIELRPIEDIIVDDKVVLNPILFDFDKSNIKPQAAFELDNLVALMQKHPNMVINVKSHTDNRGSNAYNLALSERRAQSTVQYVISKGIDKSRVSGKGFGESRPTIDCGKNCTSAQDHKNRRSEFIIVKR